MVLLYAAYFDASGKPKGYPVLTVAGAVSPVKKWIRFEAEWKSILESEGVTEFHATDFAASQGEYLGWHDKSRRSKFLKRLIATISKNVNKMFAASIELAAWKAADSEYCLSERFHSPYALAGFTVIDESLKWAKRKRIKPPAFIFEEGDDGWDGLLKLCAWDNIEPIRLPKKKAIPCQVGDMLAWKNRITATNSLKRIRAMQNTGYDEDSAARMQGDLNSLNALKVKPGLFTLFAPETLKRLCTLNRIPRREPPILP